jgi:hypothetical protein
MDIDKVQRIKDSLKYYEDLKSLREREDLDSLSDFFRSMAIRPTSKELERKIKDDEQLKELEAQNSQERDDMYATTMAGAGEFGTGEYKGPTKEQLGLTPNENLFDEVKDLLSGLLKPNEKEKPAEILLKEQIKNAIPVNLITQEELDKQTSMINRGETEPVVTEQSSPVESSDKVAATPDVKKDVKGYDLSGPDYPQKKYQSTILTPTDTSRYYNNPSELYDGIKNNDDRIYNYLYQGIAKKEWANQKPIFDFVAISKKDKGKSTSSAFGPVQIVGNTVRDAMTRMKEGSEEYNFANRLQAAQNLFINLSNGYKKRGNFDANKAANTKKGAKALNILGISAKQFKEYVDDGYFLPSNQTKSKGLPPKILGDNYEKNYYKLFKNVLLNKASGDTTSLEETLQNYHGHPTDKNQNKTYQKEVFKNLNLSTKQSGGMIESDPYKKQPRFI